MFSKCYSYACFSHWILQHMLYIVVRQECSPITTITKQLQKVHGFLFVLIFRDNDVLSIDCMHEPHSIKKAIMIWANMFMKNWFLINFHVHVVAIIKV